MIPTNDKKLLDELSYAIFSRPYSGAVGYIFYAGEKPVGFASLDVGSTSVIKAIGVVPSARRKGYGDFFTRSILFRLAQISKEIRVAYVSGYYNKFGFKKDGAEMTLESVNLKFDSKCAHC